MQSSADSTTIDDPVLINEWHVVARASEVPEGKAIPARLLGRDLVLWANAAGIHVWLDLCVHRGARLSPGRVEKECLVCPYHGWTYDSSGACTRIPAHPSQVPPARAHATVYQAKVAYDLVWVCLGQPTRDVPPFPEWADPAFSKILTGPYIFQAHGPRVVENFLDVGHLPIVHAGLLGDPNRPEIPDYEVEYVADEIIARDIPIWQPDPDGSGKPAQVCYTYQALRPLTVGFRKDQSGRRYAMIYTVTPVEAGRSSARGIMAMNYDPGISTEEFIQFQDAVARQDIPVVESQRPELLPLDLQAELHLRSDRMSIAYRQWIRKMGLTFGTA